MTDCKELTNCVCCDSDKLTIFFDLGEQELANSFHDGSAVLPKYPLAVRYCNNCFHVQLSHSVNPKILFNADYPYMSGISATMLNYFEWFAKYVNDAYPKACTVLDIACNDGSQLDAFAKHGFATFGIDPAVKLCEIAAKKRHKISIGFFRDGVYERQFDIITAQNVLAHTPEPLQFLKDCAKIMHRDSILFVQTSQADMINNNQFDTIYHEHISFFNTESMRILVERSGLFLSHVFKTDVHGTSYVFVIIKMANAIRNGARSSVAKFMADESLLRNPLIYELFSDNCKLFTIQLNEFLSGYEHLPLIGYGAAAKGINLMQFTGLNPEFIIDETPTKQNKLTPGKNIPIYPPEKLQAIKGDALIIPFAWNFFDEIKHKVKALRPNSNDKFVRYFPTMKIEL